RIGVILRVADVNCSRGHLENETCVKRASIMKLTTCTLLVLIKNVGLNADQCSQVTQHLSGSEQSSSSVGQSMCSLNSLIKYIDIEPPEESTEKNSSFRKMVDSGDKSRLCKSFSLIYKTHGSINNTNTNNVFKEKSLDMASAMNDAKTLSRQKYTLWYNLTPSIKKVLATLPLKDCYTCWR
ncbi:hypothetical protein L9F63_019484, partial [Diploptera punctata]